MALLVSGIQPVGGQLAVLGIHHTPIRIGDLELDPFHTFEIRRMDDALVDTVTTGTDGRVFVTLEAGSYYAVFLSAPDSLWMIKFPAL